MGGDTGAPAPVPAPACLGTRVAVIPQGAEMPLGVTALPSGGFRSASAQEDAFESHHWLQFLILKSREGLY